MGETENWLFGVFVQTGCLQIIQNPQKFLRATSNGFLCKPHYKTKRQTQQWQRSNRYAQFDAF
ncbi:hypothetical protein QJS10_CPB21g00951 [Acorus calamus]|uniref:Uncharacterized protein n=1 Tax=Acorus calamus TaxID=4465 RepID=A0AAV9C6D8_ACOCL|nr:hypothetical protein QJS10_CPB21g00951 [Acorus calamus]